MLLLWAPPASTSPKVKFSAGRDFSRCGKRGLARAARSPAAFGTGICLRARAWVCAASPGLPWAAASTWHVVIMQCDFQLRAACCNMLPFRLAQMHDISLHAFRAFLF